MSAVVLATNRRLSYLVYWAISIRLWYGSKEVHSAAIDIDVFDEHGLLNNSAHETEQFMHRWTIARTRKGRKAEYSSKLGPVSILADTYRTSLSNDEKYSLPLIAFYPVERVVLDIPLKIRDKHTFFQLDGYDNSLNQGVDFRRFFEWFREREDSENESGISQEVLDKLVDVIGHDEAVWQKLAALKASSRDLQLTAVRTAIKSFMPGFNNLRVQRKPRLHMSIDKDGQSLNVAQLSQGEKSLMALVGDIARRLAMMNPDLSNPLEGDGIVLIDEVDMHMHPKWQRRLIERFTSTFPNCQFVLTSHSPLVISDCKDVLTYLLDNGELSELPPLYGQDVNSVLLEIMDTDVRNFDVNVKINDLLDCIHDADLDRAKIVLSELESSIPLPDRNIELVKARILLRKQELRHEKNR